MFTQNLLTDLGGQGGVGAGVTAGERFDEILRLGGVRVERIVSHGHASEPGFWYQQNWDEWVLIISGEAVLEYETGPVVMKSGDHVLIEAGKRHRVQSTSLEQPTVWLAIHWDQKSDENRAGAY